MPYAGSVLLVDGHWALQAYCLERLLPRAHLVQTQLGLCITIGNVSLCRSIHVYDPDCQAGSGLTVADQRLLLGALEYKSKK